MILGTSEGTQEVLQQDTSYQLYKQHTTARVEKRHFPEGAGKPYMELTRFTFVELSDTRDSMNSGVVQLSESPVCSYKKLINSWIHHSRRGRFDLLPAPYLRYLAISVHFPRKSYTTWTTCLLLQTS